MKAPRLFLIVLPLIPTLARGLAQRGAAEIEEPATEAQLRAAIADIDELARGLQNGLKRYREHLQAAMREQGYGPYHPMFRTSLNGFEQEEIDLEDLDELKMGVFAYTLQDAGTALNPNPFADWREVEKYLADFEIRIDRARSVVARSNILAAHNERNIPPEALRKLRKRWLSTLEQATNTYGHALAVRAVKFENGEMVPAPPKVRRIFERGRYATICGFSVCTSQTTTEGGETRTVPLVH